MIKYDYSDSVQLRGSEQGDFGLEIPRRYEVDLDLTTFVNEFEWQATYKFPAAIRNNKVGAGTYGSPGMTYRRLYVILCEDFNNGNYFIDTYFKSVYPSRMQSIADSLLDKINSEIMNEYQEMLGNMVYTKSGRFDRRYTRSLRKLSDFKILANAEIKSEGEYLASLVKEDIKQCLSTGIIPLSKKMLSKKTVEQRMQLGLNTDKVFYATGRLIDSIKVYFRLEKKGWMNQDI